MVSLLVVFFAGTGVTLNHPDWLAAERMEELTGTLPAAWKTAKGSTGSSSPSICAPRTACTHRGGQAGGRSRGLADLRAPGYSADCFIDVRDGSYKLTVSYQGAVGVLNDLHRGRDSGSAWAWLIDVAGVFLVFLSLTGLGLLFYLRKVRVKALLVMSAGAALVVVLAKLVT
jgi:hypothetical protein